MSKHQYRVTISDRSVYHEDYPDWDQIFANATERGYFAQLERRLVAEADLIFVDGLRDKNGNLPIGAMIIGDRYISEWQIIASNSDRVGILIGRQA